jgi:hypothetical protein
MAMHRMKLNSIRGLLVRNKKMRAARVPEDWRAAA